MRDWPRRTFGLTDWWWGSLFMALGMFTVMAVQPANGWNIGAGIVSALIGGGLMARHLDQRPGG